MKLNLSAFFVLLVLLPLRFIGQMTPLYRDADSSTRLLSMQFLGESDAYVVFDKWVGYSLDSGRQFQRWEFTTANVQTGAFSADFSQSFKANGVTALNSRNVFVYGQLGGIPTILLTSDSGKNFQLVHFNRDIDSPNDAGVQNMLFIQNGNRGIAVEHDRILLSTDKGVSWQPVFIDYNANLEKIDFVDDNLVNVYSSMKILRTTNGGSTWSDFNIPGAAMSSLDFITPTKGWVVNGPYLYRTVDGENWELLNPDSYVFAATGPIHFYSDNIGIMCGPEFSTLKTTSGGLYWEPLIRQDTFRSGYKRHQQLFFERISKSLFVGGDHGSIERLRNQGDAPLPVARFRVDTSFYASQKLIYLTNFSNPAHQFRWLHQGKLISEEYEGTVLSSDRLKPDTLQLVAISGASRDTMTIILPAVTGTPPCSAAFNIIGDTSSVTINAQDNRPGMKHYWSLGDGSYNESFTYFNHQYKKIGRYTVEHILFNPETNCSDTVSKIYEVIRLSNFVKGSIQVHEEGLKINERKFQLNPDTLIEKTPSFSTLWNFGDGHTSTDTVPLHQFVTPGTYEVCVEVKNLNTWRLSSFCTTVTIPPNPDSCSAKFTSYAKNTDPSVIVPERLLQFKSAEQPNGQLIQHTWKANGRDTMYTGTDGVWQVNFFQEGLEPAFRGKEGDQCATDSIASIHVDSLVRTVTHFVYDPVTGCRDSFSLVVPVPVRKKISFMKLEGQLVPGGVRMHAIDNRDSLGWPHYSVWGIESATDRLFTGQYTEGYQTIQHVFSKTGIYRVSVAENSCSDNYREVYYTNHLVKQVGCPTYEPFIVYDKPSANEPLLITFRADGADWFSAYPTNSIRWYFGDGDSSSLVSPQHHFKEGGTYTVEVVFKTEAGCQVTKSIELDLPPVCTNKAGFEIRKDSSNAARFFFNNTSSGNDSLLFQWQFGGGDFSSVENPVHTYTSSGVYTVQLRISNPDGSCPAVYEKQVQVNLPPVCDLKASFTTIVDGNSVLFRLDTISTISNNRIHWSFGDGDTSNVFVPLHRYDTSGSYLVCVTIQNDAGCTVQFCDSVNINYAGLNMILGYPNPVQGQLIVRYFSEKQESLVLELLNESGLVLQRSNLQALPGANSFLMDLSRYKNGIYILRTTSASGIRQAFRVVKL